MNNQFSENLKKIRKEHNLSQEQLADELGVSRQAISKWESAVAYPEMDKIIALCDKFNLNIDDLLHRDIKEVKGEEESKKKLNSYIDDFLEFITDTINMFSSMNFKSKVKCLFEQLIIILVLSMVAGILSTQITHLFNAVFGFIPDKVLVNIDRVFDPIVEFAFFIAALVIVVHVFKIRYLNYFKQTKKSKEHKEENELKDETKEESKETFVKEEDKIIIRDPKHSEYKFINGLGKLVLLFIKFLLLCFALNIIAVIVCLFIGFILSFLVYKTGPFFIGLLLTTTSSAVIAIIFLLLILNFVFDRKNDKKKMIWAFILSIVFFGVGCGLISTGALQFNVSENDNELIKTEVRKHKMNDKLLLFPIRDNVKFIESDNNNIKIEYTVNKHCELIERESKDELTAYTDCKNVTGIGRDAIKGLNEKKLINISSDISTIKVYSTKDNLKKLQANRKAYAKEADDRYEFYEERINELEEENERLSEELNKEVDRLSEELNECRNNEEKN